MAWEQNPSVCVEEHIKQDRKGVRNNHSALFNYRCLSKSFSLRVSHEELRAVRDIPRPTAPHERPDPWRPGALTAGAGNRKRGETAQRGQIFQFVTQSVHHEVTIGTVVVENLNVPEVHFFLEKR